MSLKYIIYQYNFPSEVLTYLNMPLGKGSGIMNKKSLFML